MNLSHVLVKTPKPVGRRNRGRPFLTTGLLLAAVGMGCGQFSAITTITRDDAGNHDGEWTIDFELDQAVFDQVQAMSADPIDLDYRASLFRENGWEATAGTAGITAKRAITVPEDLNREDNALVRLFTGEGEDPPEENMVRWTELEIDESDPGFVNYRFAAEVYVPEVDPEEMLEQIVLSLSPGRSVEIGSDETDQLKQAMIAAGPFVLEMETHLPGEVDPATIRGGGEVVGDGHVRWRLSDNGSYLLEARSRLDLAGSAPGDGEDDDDDQDGREGADPEDGDDDEDGEVTDGDDDGKSGGLSRRQVQKGGAVVIGVFGAVVGGVGLKSALFGSAALLNPAVVVGGVVVGLAIWVWNYGPPELPNPVQGLVDIARNNVKALELSSFRGLSVEEARQLGFELETLSPAQKQAVSKQLGVPYTTLIEALKDAKEHPEFFE